MTSDSNRITRHNSDASMSIAQLAAHLNSIPGGDGDDYEDDKGLNRSAAANHGRSGVSVKWRTLQQMQRYVMVSFCVWVPAYACNVSLVWLSPGQLWWFTMLMSTMFNLGGVMQGIVFILNDHEKSV